MLNYGDDAKESWMQSGLFYKDHSEQFDNVGVSEYKINKLKAASNNDNVEIDLTTDIPVNPGLISRRKQFIAGSGSLKVIIPLHLDFLHSNRFLLNHMGLFFDLFLLSSFLLMGDNTKVWKVEITKPSIRVRKSKIFPRQTVKTRKSL